MREDYYTDEIYRIKQRIEELKEKLQRWQHKLMDLDDLSNQHRSSFNQLREYVFNRKRNIDSVDINENEVKSLKQYKEKMKEVLEGSKYNRILSKKEEEGVCIVRSIDKVEQNIAQLKRKIVQLEEKLSQLNYALREERLINDKW